MGHGRQEGVVTARAAAAELQAPARSTALKSFIWLAKLHVEHFPGRIIVSGQLICMYVHVRGPL